MNGAVLTDADLVREEYAIFPYARQHGGVPKELEPDIRAGALRLAPSAVLRDQLGSGRARAEGGWIKAELAAKSAAVFTTKRGGKSHG